MAETTAELLVIIESDKLNSITSSAESDSRVGETAVSVIGMCCDGPGEASSCDGDDGDGDGFDIESWSTQLRVDSPLRTEPDSRLPSRPSGISEMGEIEGATEPTSDRVS